MLNRIVLMGRLTHDPELRHTQSGVPVIRFSLAVNRDYKNEDGNKKADFIDIVAWRSTAEFVSKYFSKGRVAVVEGRLQMSEWTDKDCNKRRTAEVIAENIYFGDSRRNSNTGSDNYGVPDGGYSVPAPDSGGFAEIDEDAGELPF